MAYTYPAMVAWDSIGKLAVKSTSFQVYAVADTGFVTPLAITDSFGVALPGNILNSGTIGVFPEFKQADHPTVVITDAARNYVWTITSILQDASVAGFVSNKTTATAAAVRTATASVWQASVAYAVNQPVINPTGDLMRCTTAHTSTATYDSTKFTLSATDANGATSAALNATYGPTAAGMTAAFPPKLASPRDTSRVKLERKPVLLIDQIAPNANYTHKIVHAEGDTLWSYGMDFSLRKSTDKGATWGAALSNSTAAATWAKDGLFYKTSAGTFLASSHPSDLSAPKIIRSTDGITWTDVIPAKVNVDYLGVTNICQDPVTGYLYIAEYVTATAATLATWSILRSTDDGATWANFKTFQRDAAAFPTTAVRHGHGVQWDTVSQRIYFLTGDSEQAAGIYRVNAAGTDVEKVVLNSETLGGNLATAVGIMFFPNYLAWGMDQTSDSYLLRMHRNQIGAATTASVEKIGRVQSTAWYTCRVATDSTEWLMSVSNETSVGRVDAAVHVYRVADDAATMDEVLTIPTPNDTTFSRVYPIGTAIQSGAPAGVVWLGSNVKMPGTTVDNLFRGQQFAAIIGWGGQALQQTATSRPPFTAPTSQDTGNVSLTASEILYFGGTEAPVGATRLYIIDAGCTKFSGTGLPFVTVYNATTAAILKLDDTTTNMQWQNRSMRAAKNAGTAPYVFRSVKVSPGTQIQFRVDEGGAAAVTCNAYVTYAWGF